jgi:hypothetical protein
MTDMELWFLENQATAIQRHVADARHRVTLFKSRPDWDTRAMAELQRAKDQLTDLLELIAQTQREYDALPTVRLLEAAE